MTNEKCYKMACALRDFSARMEELRAEAFKFCLSRNISSADRLDASKIEKQIQNAEKAVVDLECQFNNARKENNEHP